MTRALIFDVDGVLIHGMHTNPAHVRAWNTDMLADMGVDPKRFTEEFIFDIFIKRVIIGEVSVIAALEKRLPSLGYKGSPMVFLNYWLEKDSVLNTDLLDAIRALKAKEDVRLFIATNQEHMRAHWLWAHLGLNSLFEDIFYSARIGVTKASDKYFDYVDQRIGPQAEPPLFFDDTPKVIATANAAGWEGTVFNTVDDFTNHTWVAERLSSAKPVAKD